MKEREIEKPRPSITYRKTKVNDNDNEEYIEVVGNTIKEAKETFKEIKKFIKENDS